MAIVKINGKEVNVPDNTLILDAARDAGYEIPTFCYQADLMGIGSCRMCLVEIEGQKKLQPSCVTPVLHGMSIMTESPSVVTARAGVLEFLLANHALDCPVCDKGGECELQDMVYKFGPHEGRHTEKKFKFHEKDYNLSPVIVKNSNRCVQCQKCVRVCREVVGANVLGCIGRGDHQEETSFFKTTLDCDHCGNCIEVCPVGCFMRRPYRYAARPWDLKGADMVCAYCATGCRMVVEERGGIVLRSRAQYGVGVNSETLCARGRFGFDYVNSAERLKTPYVNRYGKLEPATWEEAFEYIAESLKDVRGAGFGGVVSPRYTNEEAYLFQKLVREVFKSANVDSSSRWNSAGVEAFASAAALNEGGVSVFDAMEADAVIVVGAHISDENPITDYTIRRISEARRRPLVVVSSRAMKLDSSATQTIRHNPGTEDAFLGAATLAFGAPNLKDNAELAALSAAGKEALLGSCGVKGEAVEALAAKLRLASTISVFVGTEFLRHPQGSARLGLFRQALSASGKKVRVLPVLDRCNQRGAWEMGAHPAWGAGYKSAGEKGMGAEAMLRAAANGELGAMYVAGADPAMMSPYADLVERAFSKIKFLIVQDAFMTDTARRANVVLPGSSFAEKSGTYTNHEGRVQATAALLPPPGKAKSDYEIILGVGRMLEPEFGPASPSEAFAEIRKVNPMYSKVGLEFNNKRNTDNKLDSKAALVGPGASIAPVKPASTVCAMPSRAFALTTGNHLFHSGMLSRRSISLSGLLNAAVVEISAEDAAERGLKQGDRVRVRGEKFEAVMTLAVKSGTKKGVAFLAENFADARANRFFAKDWSLPAIDITPA